MIKESIAKLTLGKDLTEEETRMAMDEILAGQATDAQIIREILKGQKGPKRNMALLNASAAFVAAGVDQAFEAGIERAKDAIDSGRAKAKLEALISFTQTCGYFVREKLY